MPQYTLPKITEPAPLADNEAILIASGDLRLSANQQCWAAQDAMEKAVMAAFAHEGITVKRGHPYDPVEKHGFIKSQKHGMEIFASIPRNARLIVAESVWQYSYHVLAGLRDHRGPILTVANWSGEFPGLVGMLNLNGSLTKMGVPYSTLWSQNFDDEFFVKGIRQWIREGCIDHDTSHVRDLDVNRLPADERALGEGLAAQLAHERAIMGIFDEGCMGMYNAIIDDEMLNALGVYKERLSQSALVAAMWKVSDSEAQQVRNWLDAKGVTFLTGPTESDLTNGQILEQCKMYIAAVRMAHDFGCATIGIQYQQGLKDVVAASDLPEGLLNNVDRPPVYDPKTGQELYAGQALPHFNEVDEGAGLDALVTNRVWNAMGFDPATTLHDVRWGEHYTGPDGLGGTVDDFVWVFEISGAIPASHMINGYAGAVSMRQPAMYFHRGGGSFRGISKPGEIVWSRVFVMDGRLHADLGRATVVHLPLEETKRRWESTSPQWPIMHAVLHGVSRDQMMARHKANHLNVTYAPSAEAADRALAAKAAMFTAMGLDVHLCGDVAVG